MADCEFLESCPAFQALAVDDPYDDYADDATWILTSSFVILTMQSGFGLLEMGSSTPGHEVNVMLKNVFDVVFGAISYYFLGYGISYGSPWNPFMGMGSFIPTGDASDIIESGLLYSSYIFQFSFAATSTTIVSGCVAMRMKFFIYCAYAFYAVLVYAFVAHWVWAPGGWLKELGVYDFAGSGPVHLLGGTNGLFAILMLGPRLGRFNGRRPKSDFTPHSPTSVLFGLFMLWWGWIGFNCGSSFGITNKKWLVATRTAVSTINSSAGGGVGALIYTQIKSRGRFVRPIEVANGILGALVSITASCACVQTYEALIIGFIGSFIALGSNDMIEHKLHLDDPVGAIGVHAVAGIWGILAVGLFADGSLPGIEVEDGLFRGGGFRQLGVQLLEVVAIIGWSAVCVPTFFYLIGIAVSRDWRNPRVGLRVAPEEEIRGTDQFLHDRNTGTNWHSRRRRSLSILRSLGEAGETAETEQEESSNRSVAQMREHFAESRALALGPRRKGDRVLFLPRSASDSNMLQHRQSVSLPVMPIETGESVSSEAGTSDVADRTIMSSRSVEEP